ncbi:MAG TPA: metalloregulator ArsR/SmtB family transcription factor [Thermoguttaceae bacterium]
MRDFMAVTKALSDENRVRLLLALRKRELCLCQLIELLRLAPSTVSKHMSILKQAQLVESRKEGRWMYYHLSGSEAPAIVKQAIQWVFRALGNDPQILLDRDCLEEILKLDPHDLCEKQCEQPTKRGKHRVATIVRS